MQDEFKPGDRASAVGRLVRMGEALLAGGVEFYTRAAQIGLRRLTAGATKGMDREGDDAQTLRDLIADAGGLFSELLLTAPAAAVSAANAARDRSGARVLAYATPPDPNAESTFRPPDLPALNELPDEGVFVTDAVLHALSQASGAAGFSPQLRDALIHLAVHSPQLAALLRKPAGLADLPISALASLTAALPDAQREELLATFASPDHAREVLARFQLHLIAGLGASAADDLLSPANLGRVAEAEEIASGAPRTGGRARPAMQVKRFNPAFLRQLREVFAAIGHPLSETMSAMGARNRWSVRDHQSAREFFIAPHGKVLEITGLEEGRSYALDGRRFELPARVFDASQGFAFYSVPFGPVQNELNKNKRLGLEPWKMDDHHTALAVFMVDYREGDLGRYRELGIACLAAPTTDPLAIGLVTFFLGVSDESSRAAGESVWGFPKSVHGIEIDYEPDSASMLFWNSIEDQRAGGEPALRFTLPRGGNARSRDIPFYNYTKKGAALHRVTVTRSGEGEQWTRDHAAVRLEIAPDAGACQAAKLLVGLGLTGGAEDNLLYATWTENMTAELDAAVLVPFPDNAL